MNPHTVTLGSNQAVQGAGFICRRGGRFGTRGGCAAGRRSHRHELRVIVSFLALHFSLQGSPTFFVPITSGSPVRMRTTAPICATLLARRLKRIANMPNFFIFDNLVWRFFGNFGVVAICCRFCLSVVFKTSNGGKPIHLAVWAMIREISRD